MNSTISFKNVNNRIGKNRLRHYLPIIFSALAIGIIISLGIFTLLQILIIAAIVFLLFFVFNKPDIICYAMVILIFTPLSLGTTFKLKIVWIAEPVIVILFFLIVLRTLTSNKRSFVFSIEKNPFLLPLAMYLLVLFINYLRYPLPASSIAGVAEEMGGIRFYYEKLLMFLMFLSIAYLVEVEDKFRKRFFTILLIMSAVVTTIGILTFLFDQIYEIIKNLQTNGIFTDYAILTGLWHKVKDPFTGVIRTSILWITPFAIILLMSNMIKTKTSTKIILLIFFIVGLILSATRSFFFGVLLALMAWAFFTENKRMLMILILFSAFLVLVVILFNVGLFSEQFGRLFYFPTNLDKLTSFRYELFYTYWHTFKKHLIFGVGVGATEVGNLPTGSQGYFVARNLRFGGHGFFLGTLYTQGILGIVPIVLLYIVTIKTALRLFRLHSSKNYKLVGLFSLMFIIYSALPFLVGGDETYNQFFLMMGILAGSFARYQRSRDTKE